MEEERSATPSPERARPFLAAVPPLRADAAASDERPPAPPPSPPEVTVDPPAATMAEPVLAPADTSWLRRWSIRTRVLGVGVVAFIVVAVVVGLAANTVHAVDGQARRVARIADARNLNQQTLAAIDDVHDAVVRTGLVAESGMPDPSAVEVGPRLERAATLSSQVTEQLLPGGLATERSAATADAAEREAARVVDAGRGGSALSRRRDLQQEAASFATSSRDRKALDRALTQMEHDATSKLDSTRTTGLVVVGIAALVGLLLIVVTSMRIAASVATPLRLLGRSMRRFGDGDLRSRGAEASDEVGTLARSFNVSADRIAERMRALSEDAERGSQLRIIAEALDLALDEGDVHRIVEHALGIVAPGRPIELLVNEPSSSTMHRVASNPNGGAPSCPVEDTATCVAIRRARTMVYESPDTINSCPMLRDRPSGPCSAVCVPINAGGTLVGVVHATGPVGEPPPPSVSDQLTMLASQAGARIGSMRTLDASRVEASTDGLTGVANRRMLSTTLSDLLRTSTPFVLVVADLDRFKDLNDNYGHEVGDRALQLFAEVLSSNVRGRDLVARFGGEEFVLVYPEMNVRTGMEVLERIRTALADAVAKTAIPAFTASFGVTHSSSGVDVDSIIRIADAGLLMAKDLGRDRVVFADAELAAEVFSGRRDTT